MGMVIFQRAIHFSTVSILAAACPIGLSWTEINKIAIIFSAFSALIRAPQESARSVFHLF
jgi:hypothetical protein